MSTGIHYCGQNLHDSINRCVICGSKSIGMNFGVLTCAPCKAFFRRNARRKELLDLPCRHRDLSALMTNNHEMNERTMRYLQIRRCSSCRLRRCFEVGMKEELVRTDEENERYKQLVDLNRKQRDSLKQQLLQIKELSIPQNILRDNYLSDEIDWRHLSNIVYAYESCCIKTYVQQRSTVIFNRTPQSPNEQPYTIFQTQNGYITLLWKYLTHRYGSEGSVRIYLNLVHVYMKMQEVGYGMYMQLTTQKDLVPTHETLSKLVTLDINDTQ
ncbi:unnamed protein product [Adineta steineri]|uniref:Nuclear receptor domain-containing protein n=1 Tax=Adineta steineri TaxID=433720 RepID=A0A814BIU3_9BILA|nr:unnamed protein product [Adineta steineri]